MRFEPLGIAGAWRVETEPHEDERGSFSRLFSKQEFEERGMVCDFAQESVARNHLAGTLRGFHFQAPPAKEAKLVTCTRGRAFDVILDIRSTSKTFARWCAITLEEGDWASVYVPPGCAHAVQAMEDGTEILYRISCDYDAVAAKGYRWNSPALGIRWPLKNPILSERDRSLPLFAGEPR